jgi:hypothetical protein
MELEFSFDIYLVQSLTYTMRMGAFAGKPVELRSVPRYFSYSPVCLAI